MRIKWCFYLLAMYMVSVLGAAAAFAQTGSAKIPSVLNAEINQLWPDQSAGAITPYTARQTLLDMVASGLGTTVAGPPAVGYVPIATSATAAAWGTTFTAPAYTFSGIPTFSGNPLMNLIGAGFVNVSNLAQNTIQYQGQGNSLTTAIHLNPGSGTLPTGTITEFVGERTNLQAFGGNYGRWSFTNLGSANSFESGIFGEFGGTTATGAMGPYILQVGIENPPATFTAFEGYRFFTAPGSSEDDNQGAVAFGSTATVPRNTIALDIANIGGAGTRDSHAILWEGKANNGTERAAWWRQRVNVTSQAGASAFQIQQNLNGGGWNSQFILNDAGALTVGTSGFGTAGAVLTSGGSAASAAYVIPARMRYCLTGINFNSATTDNALLLSPLPTARFTIGNIRITNASASISTATIGVFTATAAGGATIAADQAITVTASAAGTNNNTMALSLTNSTTEAYAAASFAVSATAQIRIGTPQGMAATADVCVETVPLT